MPLRDGARATRLTLSVTYALGLTLVAIGGWLATLVGTLVTPQAIAGALPGQAVWRDGASSFVFGANDTYEWSPNNFETQPLIQAQVKRAGVTLIRTFIKDPSSDAEIDQRILAIERVGARCLVVLTNIQDLAFNQHVIRFLGSRCLMYEFGNEPDYSGVAVSEYIAAWNTSIPALRAINPRARFFGPVESSPGDYLTEFLQGARLSGVVPDGVTLHWYPCWNDIAQACLAKAGSIYNAVVFARAQVRLILGKDLPLGVTEWNFDPGAPPPAYGADPTFISWFTTIAITAMIRAGVSFACQYDIASYAGYGGLDMIDTATNQPKPQFLAFAALVARYKPD